MITNILRDLKYGIRLLFKNPGFTIVVVMSLAVGIGVNATVFSLADTFLLKTLPVADTSGLVYYFEGTAEDPGGSVSYLNYIDYRDQNNVFSGLASYSHQPIFLTTGARTERISAEVVSGNYFTVLGVMPITGRTIQVYDDQLAAPQLVAVISQPFWKTRLNADPQAIGQQIKLNSQSFTIVGVAPASFSGTMSGLSTDVWVPLTAWAKVIEIGGEAQAASAVAAKPAASPSPATTAQTAATGTSDKDAADERKEKGGDTRTNRDHDWLTLIGRIKPDVTLDRAQAEMTAVANRVEQTYGVQKDQKIEQKIVRLVPVNSLRARATNESLTLATLALVGTFIVLSIACINVISLVLSRATVRRNEIAVRLALGSSRSRLVQQLLTENVLLALLGGVAGLISSIWATRLLLAFIPPVYARLVPDIGIDKWVVVFTFLMSLVTSMIFGLAPALNASKVDLTHTMKESGGSSARGKLRLRNLLVVLQIAVSLVMLVSAGLFFRSLIKGQAAGDNYKSEKLLLLPLAPRDFGYNNIIDKDYARELTDRLSRLPGVQSVTLADNLPFDMAVSESVVFIEGTEQKYNVSSSIVAPHYFDTFNIKLRGRDFTERDDASAPKVAIINETMARLYWPNQDAIGKRIRTDFPQNPVVEIIGVVRDSKDNMANEARPDLYVPVYQKFRSELNLIVRSSGNPTTLMDPIQREIEVLGKALPVYDFKTLDELAALQLLPTKMAAALTGFFGLLGLIVASIGVYGIAAYSFTQRTREIGVRMALGAQKGDIIKLITKEGLTLSLIGIAIGNLGAFAVAQFLTSLLYGISPADPVTFGLISLFLTLVVLAASYIPARNAAQVNPMEALRYQ